MDISDERGLFFYVNSSNAEAGTLTFYVNREVNAVDALRSNIVDVSNVQEVVKVRPTMSPSGRWHTLLTLRFESYDEDAPVLTFGRLAVLLAEMFDVPSRDTYLFRSMTEVAPMSLERWCEKFPRVLLGVN